MDQHSTQHANGASHPSSFPSFPGTFPQTIIQQAAQERSTANTPEWYRNPATHTPAEQAHALTFQVKVLKSTDAGDRIRRLVAERVVPVARTRKEAIRLAARELGVRNPTAQAYMLGLRLISPTTNKQLGEARKAKNQRARRVAGRQGLKPSRGPVDTLTMPPSQIRAQQALRRSLSDELTTIEQIMTGWRSLSSNARLWLLGGLNTEMGRTMVGNGK